MARRILLLADDESFTGLSKYSGLPDHFFADPGPGLTTLQHDDAVFLRYDPGVILQQERVSAGDLDQNATVPAAEIRDTLFAHLLGSTVCHLVVVAGDSQGDGGCGSRGEGCLSNSHTSLSDLEHWYNTFHRQAQSSVDKRTPEYRHVLILICTSEVTSEQYEVFNRLVSGCSDDKLVDVCYVMLRRLELGSSDVLFSRYVWPVYVGRLLLRLLGRRIEIAPQVITRAWRSFEVAPDVSSMLIEEQCYEGLNVAHRRLAQETLERPILSTDRFHPISPEPEKVELKDRQVPTSNSWEGFRAKDVLADTIHPADWEAQLASAGLSFSENLTRIALDRDLAVWDEVRMAWGQVHRDPKHVAGFLANLRSLDAPSSGEQYNEVSKSWKRVKDCEFERATTIKDANSCADHLQAAQSCFSGLIIRMVFAATVTALVAWLAGFSLGYLLDSWIIPLVVGGGAALGAALAAFGPYLLERYRGELAVSKFSDLLKRIDSKTRQHHFACQASVECGHCFWQTIRAQGAARRLRLLLERVHTMLHRELQPQPVNVIMSKQNHPDRDSLRPDDIDRFQRAQRALLIDKTTLHCPVRFDSTVLDRQQIADLVDIKIEEFKSVLWAKLCRRDHSNAGLLSARHILPALRDFREAFRRAVKAEIHRQASDRIREDGLESLQDKMQEVRGQTFSHYMSCSLPPAHDDHNLTRILFFRPSFYYKGLALPDTGIEIEGDATAWSCLENLPVLGYYFEEVPVVFEISHDGYVRVKRS